MADIRINALATTATASASDDYLAIDGTANGTRKLSAYSPTFGGNLTVSGAGTNGFKTAALSDASTYGGVTLNGATASTTMSGIYGGADTNLYATAPNQVLILTAGTERARFSSTATTLAGNLTVSGTGNSSVGGNLGVGTTSPTTVLDILGSGGSEARIRAGSDPTLIFSETAANKHWITKPSAGDFYWNYSSTAYNSGYSTLMVLKNSGNLLLGTTTDNALGKLQVNGAATTAGTIRVLGSSFTTRIRQDLAVIDFTNTAENGYAAGTFQATSFTFNTAGTTALTLDSSQRTILSGALRLNNAYTASVIVPTGYVTIQDSTGTTYKVAVSL